MAHSIDWNIDQTKIQGIPEPKAPTGRGQVPTSVSAIILAGFMKIIENFNDHVLHPDQATVAKLKKLSNELNRLKGLLNELTKPGGGKIPANWASQVKAVMGEIKGTLDSIPPGTLKTQLEQNFKAVSEFIHSPLKAQFASYIKDLQAFEKVWKKMFTMQHWEGSIETEFRKALEGLLGDKLGFANILKKLDPKAFPILHKIIGQAADQFDSFYNKLMSIEAGDHLNHHGLGTVWKGMGRWDHESLKNWMESIMHKEGALKDKPFGGHYFHLVVHKYDAFKDSKVLEKTIEALTHMETSDVPLEEVGNVIHQMANHQSAWNNDSLYHAMHGLWNGFAAIETASSQAISATQSLNEKFVVNVNAALTEYKAVIELAIKEFLAPEQEVSMILSREQAAALGS